eukprot:gene6150-11542_t
MCGAACTSRKNAYTLSRLHLIDPMYIPLTAAPSSLLDDSCKGEFRAFTPPLLPSFLARGRESPLRKTSRVIDTDDADIARAIRRIESTVSKNINRNTGSTVSLETTTSVENLKNSSTDRRVGSDNMATHENEDFAPVIIRTKDVEISSSAESEEAIFQSDFTGQIENFGKDIEHTSECVDEDDNNNKNHQSNTSESIPLVNGDVNQEETEEDHMQQSVIEGAVEFVVIKKESASEESKKESSTKKSKVETKSGKEKISATKMNSVDKKTAPKSAPPKSSKTNPDKKVAASKTGNARSTSAKTPASKTTEKASKEASGKSSVAATKQTSKSVAIKSAPAKAASSKAAATKQIPAKASTANAKESSKKAAAAKVAPSKTEAKPAKAKESPKKAAGGDSTDGAAMSLKSAAKAPLKDKEMKGGSTATKAAEMSTKVKPASASKKPTTVGAKGKASDKETKSSPSKSTSKPATQSTSGGASAKSTIESKKSESADAKPSTKAATKKTVEASKPSSAPAKPKKTEKSSKPAEKPKSAPPRTAPSTKSAPAAKTTPVAKTTPAAKAPSAAKTASAAKAPSSAKTSLATKSGTSAKATPTSKTASTPKASSTKGSQAAEKPAKGAGRPGTSTSKAALSKTAPAALNVDKKASAKAKPAQITEKKKAPPSKTAPKTSKASDKSTKVSDSKPSKTDKSKNDNKKPVESIKTETDKIHKEASIEDTVPPCADISTPALVMDVKKDTEVIVESEISVPEEQDSLTKNNVFEPSILTQDTTDIHTNDFEIGSQNIDSKNDEQEEVNYFEEVANVSKNVSIESELTSSEGQLEKPENVAMDALSEANEQRVDNSIAQGGDYAEEETLSSEKTTGHLRTETFDIEVEEKEEAKETGNEEGVGAGEMSTKEDADSRDQESEKFDESKLISLEEISAKYNEEDVREGAVAPTPPETPLPDNVTSETPVASTLSALELQNEYYPGSTPAATPMEGYPKDFHAEAEVGQEVKDIEQEEASMIRDVESSAKKEEPVCSEEEQLNIEEKVLEESKGVEDNASALMEETSKAGFEEVVANEESQMIEEIENAMLTEILPAEGEENLANKVESPMVEENENTLMAETLEASFEEDLANKEDMYATEENIPSRSEAGEGDVEFLEGSDEAKSKDELSIDNCNREDQESERDIETREQRVIDMPLESSKPDFQDDSDVYDTENAEYDSSQQNDQMILNQPVDLQSDRYHSDPLSHDIRTEFDQSSITDPSLLSEAQSDKPLMENESTLGKSDFNDQSESEEFGEQNFVVDNESEQANDDKFENELAKVACAPETINENKDLDELTATGETELIAELQSTDLHSIEKGYQEEIRDSENEQQSELVNTQLLEANLQQDAAIYELESKTPKDSELLEDVTSLDPESVPEMADGDSGFGQYPFKVGSKGTEELMLRESVEAQNFGSDASMEDSSIVAERQTQEEEVVAAEEEYDVESCPPRRDLSESESEDENEDINNAEMDLSSDKPLINEGGKQISSNDFKEKELIDISPSPENSKYFSEIGDIEGAENELEESLRREEETVSQTSADEPVTPENEPQGFPDVLTEGKDRLHESSVKPLEFDATVSMDDAFTPLSDLPEDAASPLVHDSFDNYPETVEKENDVVDPNADDTLSDDGDVFESDIVKHAKESVRIAKSLDDSCEDETTGLNFQKFEDNDPFEKFKDEKDEQTQNTSIQGDHPSSNVVPQVISSPCASESEDSGDECEDDVTEQDADIYDDKELANVEDQPMTFEHGSDTPLSLSEIHLKDSSTSELQSSFPDAKTCDELRGLYEADSGNLQSPDAVQEHHQHTEHLCQSEHYQRLEEYGDSQQYSHPEQFQQEEQFQQLGKLSQSEQYQYAEDYSLDEDRDDKDEEQTANVTSSDRDLQDDLEDNSSTVATRGASERQSFDQEEEGDDNDVGVEEEADDAQELVESDKQAHSDDHATDSSDFVMVDSPVKHLEVGASSEESDAEDATKTTEVSDEATKDPDSDDSPFHHIDLKISTKEIEEEEEETHHQSSEEKNDISSDQLDALVSENQVPADQQIVSIAAEESSVTIDGTQNQLNAEDFSQDMTTGHSAMDNERLSEETYESRDKQTDPAIPIHTDGASQYDGFNENLGSGPRYIYDASDDDEETY